MTLQIELLETSFQAIAPRRIEPSCHIDVIPLTLRCVTLSGILLYVRTVQSDHRRRLESQQ